MPWEKRTENYQLDPPKYRRGPRLYSDEWYWTVHELLALAESESLICTRGTTIEEGRTLYDLWATCNQPGGYYKHPARSAVDWLRVHKAFPRKSDENSN